MIAHFFFFFFFSSFHISMFFILQVCQGKAKTNVRPSELKSFSRLKPSFHIQTTTTTLMTLVCALIWVFVSSGLPTCLLPSLKERQRERKRGRVVSSSTRRAVLRHIGGERERDKSRKELPYGERKRPC